MAYVKHALLKAQGKAMSRISRQQMVGDSTNDNAVCSAVLEVNGLTGDNQRLSMVSDRITA